MHHRSVFTKIGTYWVSLASKNVYLPTYQNSKTVPHVISVDYRKIYKMERETSEGCTAHHYIVHTVIT